MVKKIEKKLQKKIQSGGDGYTLDPNESIGGLMGVTRYSNNSRPVYEGELLQNGAGNGYEVNVSKEVGGQPVYSSYTDEDMSQGCSTKQSGGCGCKLSKKTGGSGCGCNLTKDTSISDPPVFDLIKLSGGKKVAISQFSAIQKLSHQLTPLSMNNLVLLIVKLFLNILNTEKPRKSKQMGGYISQLQDIIAPLGKNNLLVLSALLLLHYFAVERQKNKLTEINVLSGGDPFISTLTNILAPVGLNAMGSSVILVLLQQSFAQKRSKNIQSGGNPLKDLIAPLGTNAFIATGLLIIIEKMFTSRITEIKKNNSNLVGGKINKRYEELFNLIAPITFNTFAKQSFLENVAKNNLKNNSNKKK